MICERSRKQTKKGLEGQNDCFCWCDVAVTSFCPFLSRISMMRFVQIVLVHVLLVATGQWAAAAEKNAEQEEAIAAIKQMKGFVVSDPKRPGKPVIEVHLYAGKTAGIGSAPLAKLPVKSSGSACTRAICNCGRSGVSQGADQVASAGAGRPPAQRCGPGAAGRHDQAGDSLPR